MLKCLIVEDEPLAAEILSDYILHTPFLSHTHTCDNAISALDFVHNNAVDVIFLDINLPKLSGLDFIRTLRKLPKIILTTAHKEFAVQGFELQVVDYLLKPIEFSRFTKAVNKLVSPIKQSGESEKAAPMVRPFYFFTVHKRQVKIFLDEILFIESLKDSVLVVTKYKSYNTHYQLGELEGLLDSEKDRKAHV